MPPGHRTLPKTYDTHKGNNTNNKSTRPNNAENDAEEINNACISQIIS